MQLKDVDGAILVAYYKSYNHLDPEHFPSALSVRDAGERLKGILGESRTGSAVHQRITDVLIPNGYMGRINEVGKTCPFYLTSKGVAYVKTNYASALHPVSA